MLGLIVVWGNSLHFTVAAPLSSSLNAQFCFLPQSTVIPVNQPFGLHDNGSRVRWLVPKTVTIFYLHIVKTFTYIHYIDYALILNGEKIERSIIPDLVVLILMFQMLTMLVNRLFTFYHGIVDWNSLPEEITAVKNAHKYKLLVKNIY